jgi:hypothetical protein
MNTLPRVLLVLAIWLLGRSTISGAAPPVQDLDLPRWEAQRKLYLTVRRAEAAGNHREALAALISLVGEKLPEAQVPADDDPPRKLSLSVWARQRCEGMLALPAERKELEGILYKRWRSARAKNDTAAMRGVIALVGVEHPLGQEARLELARRLGAAGYSPAADQLLQELRRGPNRESAAKAVLELAEMMMRAGQLRDSHYYYRVLGRDYARVPVTADKTGAVSTGADVLAELAADKRFIGLLEERRPLKGRVGLQYSEEYGPMPERPGFTFVPPGEALPFFRQHHLALAGDKLHIWERETGQEEFQLPLPNTGFEAIGKAFNSSHPVRFGHQDVGHIALLNLGAQVVGVDVLARKILWQHDILGLGKVVPAVRAVDHGSDDVEFPPRKPRLLSSPPVNVDKDDSARIDYGKAGSLRLGGLVPMTPTRLCLATRKGLIALDPLTGAVYWLRSDVPQDCRLFDDGVHVFVVSYKADGKVAATAAYRLEDGAPVPIKDFSALYPKRLGIVDGRLLVWEEEAGKASVLRMYNPVIGRDDWRQLCAAGALPIRCENGAWAGVVEANGKGILWEARTKKPVLSFELPESGKARKVSKYRLVADADYFYLLSEEPRAQNVLTEPESLFLASAGLRTIPANGYVYAFRRDTGRLHWYNPVQDQMLLVSEIERLPMLLFASRYQQWIGMPPARSAVWVSTARAFVKHNGKMWYHNDHVGVKTYFHAIRVDEGTGKVELLGRGMKVSMWTVSR